MKRPNKAPEPTRLEDAYRDETLVGRNWRGDHRGVHRGVVRLSRKPVSLVCHGALAQHPRFSCGRCLDAHKEAPTRLRRVARGVPVRCVGLRRFGVLRTFVKDRANKALEPTRLPGMPRAMESKIEMNRRTENWNSARVTPGRRVAHL